MHGQFVQIQHKYNTFKRQTTGSILKDHISVFALTQYFMPPSVHFFTILCEN